MPVSSTHRITRSTIPSPIDTPASPAATPTENGLTVEDMTPISAPMMIIADVTMRS